MANTIDQEGLTIRITDIDSDWSWTDLSPKRGDANGVRVASIQFNPAAVNDECFIKEGTDAGPEMFYALCADAYDQRIKYFNGQLKRVLLDFSAGTFTAGSSVIIELWEPID